MDIPDTNLLLFLGSVVVISLSGVMMPGPVLAATVTKGYREKHSGLWIGLGHGIVELPLIALIYFGLSSFFEDDRVMMGIGLAGGAMLIFIGQGMLRHRKDASGDERYMPYHPLVVGIITSLSNPYFFLWWATIGAMLISVASGFGSGVVLVFALLHLSCDIFWDWFVSLATYRSRYLWKENTQARIFGTCGLVLIVFGCVFMLLPFLSTL